MTASPNQNQGTTITLGSVPAPVVKSGFHFNLGQILGVALLGLGVFRATQTGGVAATLEDPNNLIQIVNGITAIFHAQNQITQ